MGGLPSWETQQPEKMGRLCSSPAPHPGSAAAGARRGGEPPRKAFPGVNTSKERNVLGSAGLGHWSSVQPAGVN